VGTKSAEASERFFLFVMNLLCGSLCLDVVVMLLWNVFA